MPRSNFDEENPNPPNAASMSDPFPVSARTVIDAVTIKIVTRTFFIISSSVCGWLFFGAEKTLQERAPDGNVVLHNAHPLDLVVYPPKAFATLLKVQCLIQDRVTEFAEALMVRTPGLQEGVFPRLKLFGTGRGPVRHPLVRARHA